MSLILVAPALSHADVVEIVAVHDNTLFEDADGDTSNGAGPAVFSGRNGQDRTRRALLRFDAAASIPVGATLDSVKLILWVSAAPNDVERQFALHRVLRDWGEGTSSAGGGSGAPATPNDATWIHTFFPDSYWATAGGDFDALPSATRAITGIGSYTWSDAGMLADVQGWVSDPSTDFGWLLQGEESGPSTVRRFDSRESATVDQRPRLTVYFSAAAAVGAATQAGLALGPVYPNPAHGDASVTLSIARGGDGTASIEDVAGQRVATLVRGHLGAGRRELRWNGRLDNGRAAPPGIYFWRVTVRALPAECRRFIVIR